MCRQEREGSASGHWCKVTKVVVSTYMVGMFFSLIPVSSTLLFGEKEVIEKKLNCQTGSQKSGVSQPHQLIG